MVPHSSAPRFLIVGGLCYALNFVILLVATEVANLHYLPSMVISILVVNLVGWWINRTWTFDAGTTGLVASFIRYTTASMASMLSALGAMIVMVSLLGIHPLIANVLVAVAMVVVNFFLHRNWSFRKKADSCETGKHTGGGW